MLRLAIARSLGGLSIFGLGTLASMTVPAPVHAVGANWDCRIGDNGQWLCSRSDAAAAANSASQLPAAAVAAPTQGEGEDTPIQDDTVPSSQAPDQPTPGASETPGQARPSPQSSGAAAPDKAPAGAATVSAAAAAESRTAPPMVEVPDPAPTARASATGAPATETSAPATAPEPDSQTLAPEPAGLALLDQGLDWQACGFQSFDAQALSTEASAQTRLPVEVTADSAEASQLDNLASFSGDVQLQQGSQRVFAEQLSYDRNQGDLRATGQVLLLRPDVRLSAEQVEFNLDTGRGSANQAQYRLPAIMARGSAARADFLSTSNSRFTDIDYTTCAPGNSDWLLSAGSLELDWDEGLGEAHDAKLSFMGVPFIYLPVLSFPIDDRRRSGLLAPRFGYSDKLGADLATPYYLNLAPNYDLTLTPRVMSERGLMLGADLRFLSETTEGRIQGEYLHNDAGDPQDRDNRGSLSVRTHSQFGSHLSAALRVDQVSDDQYLDDFGGNLDLASESNLERAGELRYDSEHWSLLGRVQSYQTLDPTVPKAERPYERLPQVTFTLDQPAGELPLTYRMDGEFVMFHKGGGFVEGSRLDLQPGISMPMRAAHYHFEPSASLRYTSYKLDNQAPGLDDDPQRLAPILSLDGGLYYDRAAGFFGRSATQTLEPRLYYLWVPEQDHSDIPLFDTSLYDFSFDSLFRDNRFNGADRLGDANQLTLAVTSRYLDDSSGRELLRASLGNILYFEDREVQLLNGAAPLDDDTSALLGEIAADLGGGWRTRGAIMWDPNDNHVEQSLAQVSYSSSEERIVNLAYRQRDAVNTFVDLGTVWPITDDVRFIGRLNYSLSEERNLESLAGVEYSECCWKLRAVVRQYADGVGDDQDLSFMLQLELNGLGQLGNDIEGLLNDGIYGYRRDDD